MIATAGPQNAVPFGHWMLLKRLAVGGMAELFLAKDTVDNRLVVLKRILPYMAEDAEFLRMFLDEARIAALLHHANIVEVFELGQLEGTTFIAMEWVDGVDLRKVLARELDRGGAVPPGVAAWLVARLCEGLHYAHNRTDAEGKPLGIIHRDIGPQNVMLSYGGDVKLVDFGIAKATAWSSRSKPGVIKGKFLYLSPEQLTQEPLDHRSDLFAIGTLLYELTTGKSPFHRSTTEAVIYAIRMEDPELPETLRPGYPPALSKIVMKCLERDRRRRYQSADEIRKALEDFMRVDAPMTRADVVRYTAGLFGADEERTSIFIPANAQLAPPKLTVKSPPPQPEGPTDERPMLSTKTEDHEAFDADEGTAPLPSNFPLVPPPTRRSPEGPPPPVPVTTVPTGPMPPRLASAGRDREPTKSLDPPKRPMLEAAGESEEATVVSTPGMPPDLVRLPPPKVPRPGPPVPSQEIPEVSEVSVVSAGDATVAVTVDLLPPVPAVSAPRPPPMLKPWQAPPEPAGAPVEPPPKKAPRRQTRTLKRPPVDDYQDLMATMDLGGPEFDMPDDEEALEVRRRWMIRGGIAAGVILLLLFVWWVWPSSTRKPSRATTTTIQLKAPPGTVVSVAGQPMRLSDTREVPVGPLSVTYRCPGKKSPEINVSVDVPASALPVTIAVPCQ